MTRLLQWTATPWILVEKSQQSSSTPMANLPLCSFVPSDCSLTPCSRSFDCSSSAAASEVGLLPSLCGDHQGPLESAQLRHHCKTMAVTYSLAWEDTPCHSTPSADFDARSRCRSWPIFCPGPGAHGSDHSSAHNPRWRSQHFLCCLFSARPVFAVCSTLLQEGHRNRLSRRWTGVGWRENWNC